MANTYIDKESKTQVENCGDCITVSHKAMRRGKPHQQIYRPGSGPLRKSAQGAEESEFELNSRHLGVNEGAHTSKFNKKKDENTLFKNNNTENENNVNNKSDSVMDSRKRNKKPEQAIYVPKPVAQAMAERETHNNSSNDKISFNRPSPSQDIDYRTNKKTDQRNGNIAHHNGSTEKLNSNFFPRSKRFSTNRKHSTDHTEHCTESDSRYLSPVRERRYAGGRDTRQASEPRVIGPQTNVTNRMRDTRSVEPVGNGASNHNYQEKIQSKPPSGRRHSTICLESNKPHKPMVNLDALAPRFRRKYLAENNIDPSQYPASADDTWDGSSVVFKGSDNTHYSHPQLSHQQQQHIFNYQQTQHRRYPVPSYVTNNAMMPPPESNPTPPAAWSYTIPNTRGRGRGRLRSETVDNNQYGSQVLRSLTPDRIVLLSPCNSRPCTPPPFSQRNKSLENVNYVDNECRTPTKSPLSPQTTSNNSPSSSMLLSSPSNKSSSNTPREEAEEILDWSEEVELNERLEAEAMSDSMTRCSSVASLVESIPQQQTSNKSRRNKNRHRGNRNRSSSRNNRRDKSTENHNKPGVTNEADSNQNKHSKRNRDSPKDNSHNQNKEMIDKDGFKIPESKNRRRKNSCRDRSNERKRGGGKSQNNSRHSSLDRERKDSCSEVENWRDEMRIKSSGERKISGPSEKKTEQERVEHKELEKVTGQVQPGIIVLPQSPVDRSKPPVLHLPENTTKSATTAPRMRPTSGPQRTLFDPNNPNKPIIVTSTSTRLSNVEPVVSEHGLEPSVNSNATHTTDQFGNLRPAWYDPYSENFRACHYPHHLLDVKRADLELQCIINAGSLLHNWNTCVSILRKFFRESLEYLLVKDIKFCQTENVENHYWKILYYNIIEIMRKSISCDVDNKEQYKNIILSLIDEGTKYFERLLEVLEETYKFKLADYLGINSMPPSKGLGFIGLALVSSQKIFLFLGDLARYKEQVNETSNYGKCRQWYIKAHEINPKNGRPYNQLALLAVYARRKLDAVYYYMRSLMSSNPVQSAKESLISLFDENRKKYEQGERKRREEKAKLQMKEKESTQTIPGSLRREIWVHPEGGRRLHRTTSAAQESRDSEEEDLHSLTSVEVNKRFITSYLHVHGKLITKIGMENFQHAALQMLREFRVLLQQSPIPLTTNRFLHLLALNMFAIDSTQLKDPELEPRCRSEVQERALVVSLQMFNIILERCVELLQEHIRQQERTDAADVYLSQDLHLILPAIKVWCDWMLCHSSVWNPPPSCQDYKLGPSSDAWGRLAVLMNLLEKLVYQKPALECTYKEGCVLVRLPEDATMCGFTPLMYNVVEAVWAARDVDMETAQMCVRIAKILFFGTVFLCGLEPPVLKLHRYDSFSEYISVVRTSSPTTSPAAHLCNDDLLVESFSEDEGEEEISESPSNVTSGEIRSLLDRKVELERRQRTQELHRQHVQAILQQVVVSVEIEVRPRYLVPDTNCFIDYWERLRAVARSPSPTPYTLMVPLVVLSELDGLSRAGREPAPTPRPAADPQHLLRVATAAKQALEFVRGARCPTVKCVTTRGTVLPSSTFTAEEEDNSSQDVGPRNDDRILATCLSLCRAHNNPQPTTTTTTTTTTTATNNEPRKIYREVVLLTEDRNLRVKALARDVPVRELPDFLQWAGLG